MAFAGIAQLVERYLAKVQVAGSNPVSRSISYINCLNQLVFRVLKQLNSPVQVLQSDKPLILFKSCAFDLYLESLL